MLIELSLANNSLSDIAADKIAHFLEFEQNNLKVLDLHWNKFRYKGGLRLAEALETNTTLKILDLSWNLLGQWNPTFLGQLKMSEIKKRLNNKPQASSMQAYDELNQQEHMQTEQIIGDCWGRSLENNKNLIHLDLSNNGLGEIACRAMGQRLNNNHTLYGIHLNGNATCTDSLGFLLYADDIKSSNEDENEEIIFDKQ